MTIRLEQPLGGTLGLALILATLLFGVVELSFRASFVQAVTGQLVPSLGSRHHQLEMQLARMDWLSANGRRPDCIILGSSLVWLGVNPSTFEDSYQEETGQKLHCFTLGVETLPASAAAELANVVIREYQPRLLIYGTSARDYAIDAEAEDTRAILETPWLQQQLGHHSLKGWLFTHSYAARNLGHIRSLLRLDTDALRDARVAEDDLSGFLPKTRPAQEVHFQAGAADAAKWLEHYDVKPENLLGLEKMITYGGNGTGILFVEMPVSESYYDYFENGKEDYDEFVSRVDATLSSRGQPFLRTTNGAIVIPEKGWWDKSHMNAVGAEIFSAWLGKQVGKAVIEKGPNTSQLIDND